MIKARLIKKAEIAEQKPSAPLARQSSKSLQAMDNLAQKTLTQWIDARQHERSQNPRAAFAALFTATA